MSGISTSEIAYNHCISNIMRVSLYLLGPPIIELLDSVYYTIAGQSFILNCSAMNDVESPNNSTIVGLRTTT